MMLVAEACGILRLRSVYMARDERDARLFFGG